MTTHLFSGAQIVPMAREKGMIALSFLVLCTLGLSLSASAEKSALTTFDPPGSIETIPNSINRSGAITGYYFDGNIFHGFLRSRQRRIHNLRFSRRDRYRRGKPQPGRDDHGILL